MASPAQYAAQIFTLAVWITCTGMGLSGLALGWPELAERKAEPPALQAELIDTQLEQNTDAADNADPDPIPPSEQPPQPPDLPDLPPLPELPAFVQKVAPTAPATKPDAKPRAVAPRESSNRAAASSGAPSAQNLTMGIGEGRQPAPFYPREALSRRQEGTVKIQLLVGTDGQVLSAEVWEPSPWPLLNAAALGVVRGQWHFPAGPVRLYRVPIRFRIQ